MRIYLQIPSAIRSAQINNELGNTYAAKYCATRYRTVNIDIRARYRENVDVIDLSYENKT